MNFNYNFLDKIVVRTPLKPLKLSFSPDEIKALISKKEIQEAIFLSSPALFSETQKWLKGEIKSKKEELKLIYSLSKYVFRLHSRCTPFGLFAAAGISNWSENIILDQNHVNRVTRLDMNFSCLLAIELSNKDFIRPFIRYFPNNSVYILQNTVRYVEYFYKGDSRYHQICEVENSYYLEELLRLAENGATIEELVTFLINEDIERDEAAEFITELIGSQLIVSELEPSVSGEELLKQTIRSLEFINTKAKNDILNQLIVYLKNIKGELEVLDLKIGNEISLYENIAAKLAVFDIKLDMGKLFQVDMFASFRPNDCGYNDDRQVKTLKDSLRTAVNVLNKLSAPDKGTYLEEFKAKLYERYEHAEVPLLEVLDNEFGIGYARNNAQSGDENPLIDDLPLDGAEPSERDNQADKIRSFLLMKLIDAKARTNGTNIVKISESEVSGFPSDLSMLHDTMSVFFKCLRKTDEGHKLLLTYAGNPTAGFLVGRFAASNNDIYSLVKDITDIEQAASQPAIVAEIVHLPENRLGNVTIRPTLRGHEISYLSNPINSSSIQIAVEDLFVSIRNNRVFLRSMSLNKEIIPKLTNAHNYMNNSLPVYHFLCDLQNQDKKAVLHFDWGILKRGMTVVPRVEIEGVIVSPIIWQLHDSDLKILLDSIGNNETIEVNDANLLSWRKRYGIPDIVLLAQNDNELLLNFNDDISLNMFISSARKSGGATILLTEFLFDEKNAFVKDLNNQSYTNEIVAFLVKEISEQPLVNNNFYLQDVTATERNFSLGSQWLYYKFYCGIKAADKILNLIAAPVANRLLSAGVIDKWFFIRYTDTDFHIRVRFHLNKKEEAGFIISAIHEELAKPEHAELVWKVQTDTYQRELERYGVSTMELSESLFFVDSEAVTKMVPFISDNSELRWLATMKSIDCLLNDFRFSIDRKMFLMDNLRNAYGKQFGVNSTTKEELNTRFRKFKRIIDNILIYENSDDDSIAEINAILLERSVNIKPIADKTLSIKADSNQLPLIEDLLGSYIHMAVNRTLRSKHNLNEMVIYDFMWRIYRSEIAKKSKNNR